MAWATAAKHRFSFVRLAEPALERLAHRTQDTVYLVARVGDEIVCLDAREGSFPIKALTLNVGDRRPLGIGAGREHWETVTLRDVVRFDGMAQYWAAMVLERPIAAANGPP